MGKNNQRINNHQAIYKEAQNDYDEIRKEQRKQAKAEAKYLSDEELKALIAERDLDSDIYIEELDQRKKENAQRLIETIEFRERKIQINLETIISIISKCLCEEAQGIEWDDLPFGDKIFNILNNAEQGLIVSCSDGRKLRITVSESKDINYTEDGEETTYETAMSIQYACGYKFISFNGSIEKSIWRLVNTDIDADDLIRVLTPRTPTGQMLSWEKVPDYQGIMFNEKELEFIDSTLDNAIKGQEEARKIFLKMSPSERKAIFAGIKG